jgi:hypothetical protein
MANGQTTQRRATSRVRRIVPFLENLSPAARKAYEQELLDQACTFRQIAAKANGVPGIIDRNLVGDLVAETDEQSSTISDTTAPAVAAPAVPTPVTNNGLGKLGQTLLLLAAMSGTGLGGWGLSRFFNPATPVTPTGTTTTTTSVPATPAAKITSDTDLLKWIQLQSGGPAPTDLGTAIQEAMRKDPSLRDKILQMVHQTLDQK